MSGAIMSRRSGVRAAWPGVAVLACATVGFCGRLQAQAPDRVVSTESTVTGKVVAVSTEGVEVEERGGETRKIPIDQIRDVQFGGEPQSLRAARSMLSRGRAADAVEEVAKVEAADLDGAEPLVLEELEFVKAAATGRAALAAGADPKDAGRMVGEFLAKHPQSHHFYDVQQLLGDLLVRAGKPDLAIAAYATLAKGPPALKVRSAAAFSGSCSWRWRWSLLRSGRRSRSPRGSSRPRTRRPPRKRSQQRRARACSSSTTTPSA